MLKIIFFYHDIIRFIETKLCIRDVTENFPSDLQYLNIYLNVRKNVILL